MKSLFSIFAFLFSVAASADQFKTVTYDDSSKNYYSVHTIHSLLPGSVPAFQKINDSFLSEIRSEGCDAEEAATVEMSYDYSASARIIGLNTNYVAYEVWVSSYCGGAHPNYSQYYKTFNAKTGENVDMNANVTMQGEDVDYEVFEKYQGELAEIIYESGQLSQQGNGCYDDMTKQEVIESLQMFYPYIAGLAKGKQVVLAVSTPHAAAPCSVAVRVPLSKVQKFFGADSEVPALLNY